MIDPDKLPPTDECFTYTRTDTRKTYCFAVGAIIRAIRTGKLILPLHRFDFRPADIEHIEKFHGIERVKLNVLSSKHLHIPVLVVQWNDGQQTLIDGNHRVVKRARKLGLFTVEAYVLSEPVVDDWCIDITSTSALMKIIEEAAQKVFTAERGK